RRDLLAEPGEVGGQHRRRDLDGAVGAGEVAHRAILARRAGGLGDVATYGAGVDEAAAPPEELELDVTAVVAGGDGLARDPGGRVTFVAGALPGERVVAEVVDRRRDFARAAVRRILVASPD